MAVTADLDGLMPRLEAGEAGRVAVRDALGTLDGPGLARAARDAAGELRTAGVAPGHRVLIITENSVATTVAYLAALEIGAWPVPINARITAPEIARIRAHATPAAEVFTVGLSSAAKTHADDAGARVLTTRGDLALVRRAGTTTEPIETDRTRTIAALLYTSGTTGDPKGVMLTRANLGFIARNSGQVRGLVPSDKVYSVLPISHVFGLASAFLGSLAHGAELHLIPRFDAEAVVEALERDGITIFQGVPTMYQRVLQVLARDPTRARTFKLRYLSSGGAPLDISLKQRVEAALGLPLHNGYGLTETSPTLTVTEIAKPATDDSSGPVIPGAKVRIVDPQSGDEAKPGTIGEVWAGGPGIMRGYYRNDAETRRVITADGWFKTGDLGRIGPQGDLYIVGRLKELIIRSGFNVLPPEVETILVRHPAVALAAVVGRPVEGNEEVIAYLEAKPGMTIDIAEVERLAATELAPYKRPARYIVLPHLPVTPAGKIKKNELKLAAAEL